MRDPYDVLGVPPGADLDDVTAAYRRLARQWHPDHHTRATPHEQALAEMRMAEVSDAYRRLLDPLGTARERLTQRRPVDDGASPWAPPTDAGRTSDVAPFDYRTSAPEEFFLPRG